MRPLDLQRAAEELLSAALNNHVGRASKPADLGGLGSPPHDAACSKPVLRCRSAVEEVVALAPECWPTQETADIACAIASLAARRAAVDTLTVYEECGRLGLEVSAVRIAQIGWVAVESYVGDLSARAEALRDGARRNEIRKRAQCLAREAFDMPSEQLADMIAQMLEAVESRASAGGLRFSDVLHAGAPPEPIFEGGAVPGTLALLVAESGRSKSFLAIALSASVATGHDFIPPFTAKTKGRVIYLSFEDPACVIRLRLGRIREAAGAPQETIDAALEAAHLAFICDVDGPLFEADRYGRVSTTRTFADLERVLRQARPVMLVIDPLSGAAAIADENSNAQVGVVAAQLAQLARQLDIVVLLVHHTGKAAAGGPVTQHAARGASALACRSRWIMQLTPRGPEDADQKLLEARVVKDSYHVPHEPVILERRDGGALRAIQQPPDIRSALCDHVGSWLAAHSEAAVTIEGVKQRKGRGRDLYTHIVREFPGLTPGKIAELLREGVAAGELALRESARGNRHKVMALSRRDQQVIEEAVCPF
jgi:hypothetical protein